MLPGMETEQRVVDGLHVRGDGTLATNRATTSTDQLVVTGPTFEHPTVAVRGHEPVALSPAHPAVRRGPAA